MFALMPGEGGSGAAPRTGAGRFVLPRLLRRPARALTRMLGPDFDLPPFTATALSAALLAATGLYGAALGGHFPAMVEAVTARTGLAVTDIQVTGNRETSEIDVIAALGLNGYTSLAGYDASAARERVGALPWVEAATIRKVYPNRLEVEIGEKAAFAIWQHQGELMLVEKNGQPIAPLAGGRHAGLPLVVGAGAADRAAGFIAKVARHPQIASMAVGYIRIAGRRWNLRLDNGVTVKLPEGREEEGLATLARLQNEQGLLTRDIVAVDLRLSDRIALQLSPEAAKTRQAAMKELLANKGRRI